MQFGVSLCHYPCRMFFLYFSRPFFIYVFRVGQFPRSSFIQFVIPVWFRQLCMYMSVVSVFISRCCLSLFRYLVRPFAIYVLHQCFKYYYCVSLFRPLVRSLISQLLRPQFLSLCMSLVPSFILHLFLQFCVLSPSVCFLMYVVCLCCGLLAPSLSFFRELCMYGFCFFISVVRYLLLVVFLYVVLSSFRYGFRY